ncbi:Cell cycle serine/threonine-protein kinase cdc5/MSD2 [Thecaphora frezii]
MTAAAPFTHQQYIGPVSLPSVASAPSRYQHPSRAPLSPTSSRALNQLPNNAHHLPAELPCQLSKPLDTAAPSSAIATYTRATAEAATAQFDHFAAPHSHEMYAQREMEPFPRYGPAASSARAGVCAPQPRGPLAPSELYTNDRRRQLQQQQQQMPTKAAAADADAKRKSKKPQLPSPPKVIIDSENRAYQTGQLLGQGGFARVYEAVDPEGRSKAFKVIAKSAILKSKKNRQKILAEIMIHRSLDHLHVVKFEDTFEDEENVYFRLELCRNGSLNDIVKRRGAFTEPEARYLMTQILCGCQNMHQNSIIHRDLKLGNIMLDEKMNVKIGDFGLAALLKYPEERKKTVCGTPNYIAPEVLYDQGEGHSFEVDVWSVGVILYTLLVGKPPFQTNNVTEIYERIKRNDYAIPPEARVSPEAQELITNILTHNPAERPTLVEIMDHAWFRSGPVPLYIPSTATKGAPFLPALTQQESQRNFEILKRQAQWNPDADKEVEEDEAIEMLADEEPAERKGLRDELRLQEEAEESRERMDREFQKAIEPGSPISALLKASRQPLVKAPPLQNTFGTMAKRNSSTSLARQLGNLALSRQQSDTALVASKADKENAGPSAMAPPSSFGARGSTLARNATSGRSALSNGPFDDPEKRLLQQKARLVAGMGSTQGRGGALQRQGSDENLESQPPTQELGRVASKTTLSSAPSTRSLTSGRRTGSSLESMTQALDEALSAISQGALYTPVDANGQPIVVDTEEVDDELNGTRVRAVSPKVFLISWIDHSERYGLGYALSDNTVGVSFRDSTSMILSATKTTMDYISTMRARPNSATSLTSSSTPSGHVDQLRREHYEMPTFNALTSSSAAVATTAAAGEADGEADGEAATVKAEESFATAHARIPSALHAKVKVMRYFESEIMERLYGADGPLTFVDHTTKTGMTFVHKWYRCRDAIVFRLSNGTVQFNFYDHTKVFFTHRGQVISVLEPYEEDKKQRMKSWSLAEFVDIVAEDRSRRETESEEKRRRTGAERAEVARTSPLERRLCRRLVKKVKFARDTLRTTMGGGKTLSASSTATSLATASTSSTTTTAASKLKSLPSSTTLAAETRPRQRTTS